MKGTGEIVRGRELGEEFVFIFWVRRVRVGV